MLSVELKKLTNKKKEKVFLSFFFFYEYNFFKNYRIFRFFFIFLFFFFINNIVLKRKEFLDFIIYFLLFFFNIDFYTHNIS